MRECAKGKLLFLKNDTKGLNQHVFCGNVDKFSTKKFSTRDVENSVEKLSTISFFSPQALVDGKMQTAWALRVLFHPFHTAYYYYYYLLISILSRHRLRRIFSEGNRNAF